MKFAKVIFLHLSVIVFTGGASASGGSASWGGFASGGGQTPPWDTMGYGQRAGGTHATGMHSRSHSANAKCL